MGCMSFWFSEAQLGFLVMGRLGNIECCKSCFLPVTHETLVLDEDGICNICKAHSGAKASVDWDKRLDLLDRLIDEHKGKYPYDCLVPYSGGKDSTYTLWFLKNRYPDLRPLVVRFNHGFLRKRLDDNCDRVFRKLGVDVVEYKPSWHVVRKLMLQAFIEKGDFCWHCHTGIFAYPMHVALQEKSPLIFWGEPSAEYTAYYSYDEMEKVDEERFNRIVNLGITADDMLVKLEDMIDDRSLDKFRYPEARELASLGVKSVCLGSYIPWDVKKHVDVIKMELGWQGDEVENVPPQYNYEKIECWMQGTRDYIKYVKRGYTRPSHLAAIDVRNGRLQPDDALKMINEWEGRRPKGLDLFLEYMGLTEDEFYDICLKNRISPWEFDKSEISEGTPTHDFRDWASGDGISGEDKQEIFERNCLDCSSCS